MIILLKKEKWIRNVVMDRENFIVQLTTLCFLIDF